jgi:hypothetical protein
MGCRQKLISVDAMGRSENSLLECCVPRFKIFKFRGQAPIFFVQGFDGGECDAVLVDRRDVPIVFSHPERRIEILRHRANMPHAALCSIAPYADGQRGHLLENRMVIERRDIGLCVAIAQTGPRAGTRR